MHHLIQEPSMGYDDFYRLYAVVLLGFLLITHADGSRGVGFLPPYLSVCFSAQYLKKPYI